MARAGSIAFALACGAIPVLLIGTLAASESDDVTFTGTTDSGGVIQITITADHAAITRLALEDTPLNCEDSPPSPVSQVAYFSPPVPITDGAFELHVSSRTSAQSGPTLTLRGELVGNGAAEGSVEYSEPFGCELELGWHLDGTVDTRPAPNSPEYSGYIGSSPLTVTTDIERAGLTSLTLADLNVPACTGPGGTQFVVPSMQLKFTASFEPPQLNPTFRIGETDWLTSADVETISIRDDAIEGTLTIATSAYTTECSHDFEWEAVLVASPSTVTPPAQLPETGVRGDSETRGILFGFAATLLIAGLASIGLAFARPTS